MSNALEYAMNKAKSFKTRREFLDYLASILPKLDTEQAKVAASFIEDEVIKESRTNYYQYVKLMGPVLMGEFVDGRHIEIIATKLQRAAERAMKKGTKRYKLKINMPPGASKTQLCSRMFGSWVIGRWPWAKLLICTHGLVFGRDEIGMKMLDIMRTDEYRKIFPEVELREDKQTAGRFLTTDDGEMLITSLSAGTSGRRGHIILADDAVIESDAISKDIRAKRNSEYTTNIRTRFQPGYNGAEIVIGTAWSQGDLFDYVEEADKHSTDKWDIIKFPALLTDQASEVIRKKDDPEDAYLPGTSFWPEMYTTEQLENIRSSMRNDMARWNALYMQSPTPETGAIFNAEDFRVWRDTIPPPVHTKLLVLDTAYTKGKQSDPSAYSLFGIFNRTEGGQTRPNIILLDANKGKWDFPELLRKIETLYSRKKPEYIVIEKQSSGLALIPELRNRGLPIVEWRTQKDKIARAHSVSPLVKSGIFWVPMPDGDDHTAQKSMDYISTICALSQWDLCFTPDMYVNMSSNASLKRISDIQIGDKIMDAHGVEQEIVKVYEKPFVGDLKLIKPTGLLPLSVTPNHPFLAVKGRGRKKTSEALRGATPTWVNAGDLSVGDYLVQPIDRSVKNVDSLDILDYLGGLENKPKREFGRLADKKVLKVSDDTIQYNWGPSLPVKRHIKVDNAFMRLLGWYIAEGSFNGRHQISFALNSNETEYAAEIQNDLMTVFGVPSKIHYSKVSKCMSVRCSTKLVSLLFKALVPDISLNKKIPEFVMQSPLEKQKHFLSALIKGDGSWRVKSLTSNSPIVQFVSSSVTLAHQVQALLLRFDIVTGVSVTRKFGGETQFTTKATPSKTSPLWILRVGNVQAKKLIEEILDEYEGFQEFEIKDVGYTDENYAYRRIRSIDELEYSGWVYNLETTGSHTYVVQGAAVHNCDTFTSGLMYMRDENLLIGDNYTTTEDEFYYEEADGDDYETRGSYVGALLG